MRWVVLHRVERGEKGIQGEMRSKVTWVWMSEPITTRWTTRVSLTPDSGCYVNKFAQDKALKFITRGKLTFDERRSKATWVWMSEPKRRSVSGGIPSMSTITCQKMPKVTTTPKVNHHAISCHSAKSQKGDIFNELVRSDRRLKASREGSK